jgi:CPA2 family monovalent cation:H+ antiporter-2
MHNVDLILTLVIGLTAALVLGYIATRLKLPAIVGYLAAGLTVGPHTPGFAIDRRLAEQLAEVGVILLMFGVGLHFHLKDLLAVRRIVIVGALLQSAAATLAGALAAHAFGWSWPAGIVFGLTLSVASTVVFTRVAIERGELHTRAGRIIVGWLVVEDIFAVFMLVVLPVVFSRAGAAGTSVDRAMEIAALKLVALSFLMLGPGAKLIPRLLTAVARTNSRELFTLAVLALALGLAVGSAALFGVSMALGAFLAGMVVGQSEFSFRAASEALPMRDAFAVLFFVSVGMLFDPQSVLESPLTAAAALVIVLVITPATAAAVTLLLGYGIGIGLRVAAALAQIGEFSFMLTALGDQLGVLPANATDAVVAASLVSIMANPLVYRTVPGLERWLLHSRFGAVLRPARIDPTGSAEAETRPHAVVVGYGPVGQSIATLLAAREITPVIVELNIDTVRRLQRDGIRAVYGDAARTEVLEQARVASAAALILSAPASPESAEIVRAARALNPGIQVLARSTFLSQVPGLHAAGADQVFSGEAEVAMAMIDAMLRHAGATPEQMDFERARVRAALYPGKEAERAASD